MNIELDVDSLAELVADLEDLMMRMVLCLGILLAVCACTATAQEWVRAFGSSGFEYGYNIYPTADGGFITAGTQQVSPGSGIEHFWVARFDSSGTLLWDRRYGKPGVTVTLFGSSPTRDGGLMLGGFTNQQFSGDESALMYRIDSAGNELWMEETDYHDSDHFHFFVERKNGGYYFGGHTDSKGDPRGDMWLVRYDDDRNVIWEKEYDNGVVEHAHWGIETSDGGALLLGHTAAGGREKYWLVKVDSTGDIQWDKVYGSNPNDHDSPYHLFETAEGNYAMIGGSSSATSQTGTSWLLVVDSTGNILIDRHYGNSAASTFTWSGRQTSDGGFVIAGYTTFASNGREDMYVVKTDAAGNAEWEKTFGGAGGDYLYDVIEIDDGYIAAGFTGSGSIMTGGGGDLVVVRLQGPQPAPAATVLVSPPDGTTVQAADVTLNWQATPTAQRYQLHVSASADFASSVINDSTLTSTMKEVAGLTVGSRYYWRVRAANESGWGPYSDEWSFVVGEDPAAVDATQNHGQITITGMPNPTAGPAVIGFTLPGSGYVKIDLIDLQGRRVAEIFNRYSSSGEHRVRFDGGHLPAATYICRIEVVYHDGTASRSMHPMMIVH